MEFVFSKIIKLHSYLSIFVNTKDDMAHEVKIMLNPLRTLKDGRKSLILRLTESRKRN